MKEQVHLPILGAQLRNEVTDNTPSCCSATSGEMDRWKLWSWSRIIFAIYLTGVALVLAIVINITAGMSAVTVWNLQLALISLTSLVLILLGPDFAVGTWRSARRKQVSFELLILAAMTGAFVYSLASVVSGEGAVYFEVIAVLLVIYAVGQRIKKSVHDSAKSRATRWSVDKMQATRFTDAGTQESIPVDQVRVKDVVIVHPASMIPVDGIVIKGSAFVREAALTGESVPTSKNIGDKVFAGTICIDGTLRIEATCKGDKRAVDRIFQAVEMAQRAPSSTEDLTQRLARWFFPTVVFISIFTAIYWSSVGSWDQAMMYASAVLLVACPCALGLATPVAIWAALSELAARGIVSKNGDAVTSLAATDFICFDKTGTLTSQNPLLYRMSTNFSNHWADHEVKAIVATVERTSKHPIANAVSQLAPPTARFEARQTKLLPGRGIKCDIMDRNDGRIIEVEIIRNAKSETEERHVIDILFDGIKTGELEIGEQKSNEISLLMKNLSEMQIESAVLSGDAQVRVEGIEATHKIGNLTSEGKRQYIQSLQPARVVAFVGDGFNDAEAMAVANVSIAAAWGTDFAADTADIIWLQRDFSSIVDGIKICRKTRAVIRSNLLLAAGYNALGIGLAATGWLHPVAAAVLMLGSSLTVTLRASSIRQPEG